MHAKDALVDLQQDRHFSLVLTHKNKMSSQGIPLEVCYFKADAEGFMEREDFTVLAPIDTPLSQSILQIPPLASRAIEEDAQFNIICQGDNYKGKEIDLDQTPLNVEHIVASMHSKRAPILFVTSVKRRHDSGISVEYVERSRTLHRRPSVSSNMLRSVLKPQQESSSCSSSNEETVSIQEETSSIGPKSMSISPEPSHSNEVEDVFEDSPSFTYSPRNKSDVPDLLKRQTMNLSSSHKPPKFPSSYTLKHSLTKEQRSISVDDKAQDKQGRATLSSEPITVLTTGSKPFVPRGESFLRKNRLAFKKRRASTLDLNVRQLTIRVSTDSGYEIDIPSHSHLTVGELKHTISHELSSVGKLPGAGGLALTYSLEDKDASADTHGDDESISPPSEKVYELVDDAQLLINTMFLQQCDEVPEVLSGLRVGPLPAPVRKDLVTIYRITQLTQVILDDRVAELGGEDIKKCTAVAAPDKPEMEAARRTLHDFVMQVTSERSTEDYVLSVDIAKDAAPTTLILKVPFNNHVPVTFHYKQVFSLTKKISIHKTADSVLNAIHHCLVECDLIKNSVEAYTMQMSGINSYIHGNQELIAFADIRRCITKKEAIHMSILMKPSPLLYEPFDISWLPLDPHSYKPPLQVDVSDSYRRETTSLWEYPEGEGFHLKLVRVENLPFDSPRNLLTVELSIHHGSEMIHSARTTEFKTQDSFTMTWNEDVTFIIPFKDLPKAAKVMVVIRNSNSGTYYWGMINIFDHQSRIRSGDNILHLWEVKGERNTTKWTIRRTSSVFPVPIVEKEKEAFSSILSGPAADNPHPSAVRAVLNFGSHDKSVYYPSVSEQSRRSLFSQHPAFRNVKLKKHFSKYLELKFNMRRNKKPYHNLPVHLESIKWGSLKERLEVYNVLDTISNKEETDENGTVSKDIEKIPLFVAFRLLDKDFPDEQVRAFATKIVEYHVKSDTLEDYLLQLIQALKFEHNHDSALARYLLKQALVNKNIGHKFFWYLRGEMQSPQYMLRFAVILEAYLKGCGEALLTKYMDHVTMQDSLVAIGQKLKGTYGKDSAKMQQVLPAELLKAELQKITIVPAYNPRLRLGGLRPLHCRVMSSAKKPIFLEMLNVNSTALATDPVRLIMKMGDDLRQDVITLRMLSLFEKLWENEGLDLKLIPYGCMATGPRTGFIEVVKNSKTIAEVSGVRENKKLFEWIKLHQKDA
ncbi:phosphatidylinositol 4,5-bisphosphate 3-kinase catalytic subunit gamma isoform-like isoform X2 [Halichondria panicea]|uniref:phosphatidylinositol 4,5-bisphosphate 3-kinase catalytic subunit gamma isoform-like isoform X2 n=1 Tax=Halichondria panicea TaxID=6063 RepID=UPI00312B35BC